MRFVKCYLKVVSFAWFAMALVSGGGWGRWKSRGRGLYFSTCMTNRRSRSLTVRVTLVMGILC